MILSDTISKNIDIANHFKHKSVAKKWFCGGGTNAENMVHNFAVQFYDGSKHYFILNEQDFEQKLIDYFKK